MVAKSAWRASVGVSDRLRAHNSNSLGFTAGNCDSPWRQLQAGLPQTHRRRFSPLVCNLRGNRSVAGFVAFAVRFPRSWASLCHRSHAEFLLNFHLFRQIDRVQVSCRFARCLALQHTAILGRYCRSDASAHAQGGVERVALGMTTIPKFKLVKALVATATIVSSWLQRRTG